MEQAVAKNRIVIVLAVVALIFAILWFNTARTVERQKSRVTSEAALRYELEEKTAKLEKEKSNLADQLKHTKAQLDEQKAELEETKKTLSQEQVAEQALKVELERVTRLKESLEKDFKNTSSPQAQKESK